LRSRPGRGEKERRHAHNDMNRLVHSHHVPAARFVPRAATLDSANNDS
jgi:hypothetical protein